MPTTVAASTQSPGSYPTAMTAVTMTATDVANGNHFVATGNDLIIAWNNSATPYTVTITSQLSDKNRLGTITTQAIAADAHLILGPLKNAGWINSSGQVLITASNIAVEFGIIKL